MCRNGLSRDITYQLDGLVAIVAEESGLCRGILAIIRLALGEKVSSVFGESAMVKPPRCEILLVLRLGCRSMLVINWSIGIAFSICRVC